MCHSDPGTVHALPDPCITRAMVTAVPEFAWAVHGVPEAMVAFMWGKLEGSRGTQLPIVEMHVRGIMLIVTCSEPLNEWDQERIRADWSEVTKSNPPHVVFSVLEVQR